jgi:hypothetical protein
MFMCSGYIISFLCPIYANIYVCECLEIVDVCFLVNMLNLENPDVPVFEVLLTKPDDLISKSDCLVLTDLAYVSLNFNCYDPPVMCIT